MRPLDRKIRVKGGPKRYKSGPRATGFPRLAQRLYALHRAAQRLAQTDRLDAGQAAQLAADLEPTVRRAFEYAAFSEGLKSGGSA